MKMTDEQFEQLVNEALESLPEKFKKKMHNVAILTEDFPSNEQMKKMRLASRYALLGLYEGYIQSRRLNFGVVMPDKITIFKKPILQNCRSFEECRQKIFETVKHEIAHHFGSDEKGAGRAGRKKIG